MFEKQHFHLLKTSYAYCDVESVMPQLVLLCPCIRASDHH